MITLAKGAGAARLIGILSIPILTRIYSPDDYGVLAVFTSLVLVVAPLLALRYVIAIPLPRRDAVAINVVALSVLLLIAVSLVLGTLIWIAGPALLATLSMGVLVPWLWLVVVGGLCAGTFEMLTLWATRRRDYTVIARSQVLQSGSAEALRVGLGLLAIRPLGLLVGQVVGHAVGACRLLTCYFWDFRRLARYVRLKRIRAVSLRYLEFPLFRLPSQFLLIFSMQAPPLFTAAMFDAATTGQLGLAMMALLLPMNLLGYTMGRAYYAEISSLGKANVRDIRELTVRVSTLMVSVGLPIAAVILLFGPAIFVFVFGAKWSVAGQLASIMSPFLVFQFLASPITQVFNVVGSQKSYIWIYSRQAFLTALPFGVGAVLYLEIHAVLAVFSALLSIHYLLIFLQAWFLLRKECDMAQHRTRIEG